MVNVLWLFPRIITMFKYYTTPEFSRNFLFPIYYTETRQDETKHSILWLFHPLVTLWHLGKATDQSWRKHFLFPLYYRYQKSTGVSY